MEKTLIKKERILYFPGEVFVNEGKSVVPTTLIAKTVHISARPFIIDIAWNLHISPNEIKEYMVKKEGDAVKTGDTLAFFKIKDKIKFTEETYLDDKTIDRVFGNKRVTSPVDGIMERISMASGHIIIREVVDRDVSPRSVNVAEALGMKPKEIKRFIKKKIGENVEKDGNIAEVPIMGGFNLKVCKSPIFGEIKSINEETGEVVVQRPHNKMELLAMLPGTISKLIPGYGAVIELTGYQINGVIGFGGERCGKLETQRNQSLEGKVFVSETILSKNEIEDMKKQGIKGLILSKMQVSDIEAIFGEEVYSGTTGKINKGITIVVLDGFGTQSMEKGRFDFFNSLRGKDVYLNGTTQIRAGVVRPEIIISD
ncbi:MAG: hypothetical protein PHX21_08450 [bacterium]|nr:hypothetical protein [bacterium]